MTDKDRNKVIAAFPMGFNINGQIADALVDDVFDRLGSFVEYVEYSFSK